MAEIKKSFGLVHFLSPKSVIYYESVSSELQVGRVADLLAGLNRSAEVSQTRFRSVTTLLLSEACRNQINPQTLAVSADPILLEYGADSDFAYFAVSFVADPKKTGLLSESVSRVQSGQCQTELELRLLYVTKLGDRFSIKFHEDTQRTEWVVGFKRKSERAFEDSIEIEFSSFAGELIEAPVPKNYEELGDVEYKDIMDFSDDLPVHRDKSSTEQILAAAKPSKSEVIKKFVDEESLATVLADADPVQTAETLLENLTPEEVSEIITTKLTPEKKAEYIAKSMPQQVGEIIRDSLSEEEIQEIVQDAMPEEEKARILTEGLSDRQLKKIIRDKLPDAVKAKIIAESNKEEAVRLIKENLEPNEIEDLIEESLPEEDKAKMVAESMTQEEIEEIVVKKLTKKEKATLISNSNPEIMTEIIKKTMTREQMEEMVEESLPSEERAKLVASEFSERELKDLVTKNLTPQEKAQIVADANPEQVAELLKSDLKPKQLTKLIEESLPQEEKAKIVAASMTTEEINEVVVKKLSSKEKAKIVADSAPDVVAEVLKKTLTPKEIEEVIQESLPDEEKAKALSQDMSPDEVVAMIKDSLPPAEQATILAHANPEEAVRIIKGSIPEAEVEQIIRGSLPNEEKAKILSAGMAPEEVKKVIEAGLSVEEKAQLFVEQNPEEAATLIQGEIPQEELKRIIKGMSPEALAQTLVKGLPQTEMAQMVRAAMPQEEVANIIKGSMPEAELGQLVRTGMNPQDLVQLLSANSSNEELAKMVVSGAPPEEIANLVVNEFPMEELMRILGEGLPKMDLASIVNSTNNSRYKEKIDRAASLLSMGVTASELENRPEIALGKTRDHLTEDEISIIKSEARPQDAIQILTQVLPPPVAEAILFGELERHEVEKTVTKVIDDISQVGPITDRLMEMAAQVSKRERQKWEDEQKEKENKGEKTENKAGQKNLELKVDQQQKALKFYQAKMRELETQTRTAEAEKRKAIQDIKSNEYKLSSALEKADRLEKQNAELAARVGGKQNGGPGQAARREKVEVSDKSGTSNTNAKTRIAGGSKQTQDQSEIAIAEDSGTQRSGGVAPTARKMRDLRKDETSVEGVASDADTTQSQTVKAAGGKEKSEYGVRTENSDVETSGEAPRTEIDQKGTEQKSATKVVMVEKRSAEKPPSTDAEASAAFYKNRSSELEKKLRLAEASQRQLQSQILKQKHAPAEDAAKASGVAPDSKRESVEILSHQVRDLQTRLRTMEKEKAALLQDQKKLALEREKLGQAAGLKSGSVSEAATDSASAAPVSKAPGAKTEAENTKRTNSSVESVTEDKSKQVLQEKLRSVETELRKLENEKKQWIQQQKRDALQNAKPVPSSSGPADGASGPDAQVATKSASAAKGASANAANSVEDPEFEDQAKVLDHFKTKAQVLQAQVVDLEKKYQKALQDLKKAALAQSSKKAASAAVADDTGLMATETDSGTPVVGGSDQELEEDSAGISRGVDGIAQKIEAIRGDVKDERVRSRIDVVMQEVIAKRAELDHLSRKLVGSIKKKELQYRQSEGMLHEEIRRSKETASQALASGERQKELLLRFQKELEKARGAAGQAAHDQSQSRVRAEQAQRQVEEMQREIERLNRRAANPQKQASGPSHKESELAKQVEMASKAVLMKKQEIEVIKKQMADRLAQEAEYKKVIFKLQNELRAAQMKKAG